MGMIPIERGSGKRSMEALDTAARVLERGELFGIFPEGTRSRDGLLHKGRAGLARLAVRTGAPIIPVGIRGTDRVQPPGSSVPAAVRALRGPLRSPHRDEPVRRAGARCRHLSLDHGRGDVRDQPAVGSDATSIATPIDRPRRIRYRRRRRAGRPAAGGRRVRCGGMTAMGGPHNARPDRQRSPPKLNPLLMFGEWRAIFETAALVPVRTAARGGTAGRRPPGDRDPALRCR